MKVSLCSHTTGMLTSALVLSYASESVTYRFIPRCKMWEWYSTNQKPFTEQFKASIGFDSLQRNSELKMSLRIIYNIKSGCF